MPKNNRPKFTPGPLRPVEDAQGICGLMHPHKNGVAVAWFSEAHKPVNGYVGSGVGMPERQANVTLFLNAETMYICLSRLMNELPQRRDWLDPDLERLINATLAEIQK